MYRERAFERLQNREYRTRPRERDVRAVYRIAEAHRLAWPLLDQIERDLKAYLLYDSLAMWLDPKAGLAAYAPEAMIAIGRHYFGEE